MRWLILSSVSGELSSVQQVYFTDYIYKPAPQRHSQMTPTLVFATANPVGIADHHGLYLNPTDIQSMVTQIETANMQGNPIPVHVEHVGRQIGKVVSAWETNGRLDCVLAIDNTNFEGSIGTELVRSGLCKDLSLGYTVSLENSSTHGVRAKSKTLKEISIVKRDTRPNCKIHGVV